MAPVLRAFDLLCAVCSFGSVRPKKLLKAFSDEDFRTFYIMWMERGLELQVCRKSTRQRRPIRAVRVPPTRAALASQAAIRSTGAVRPLGRGPFPSAEPYGILRNFPIRSICLRPYVERDPSAAQSAGSVGDALYVHGVHAAATDRADGLVLRMFGDHRFRSTPTVLHTI